MQLDCFRLLMCVFSASLTGGPRNSAGRWVFQYLHFPTHEQDMIMRPYEKKAGRSQNCEIVFSGRLYHFAFFFPTEHIWLYLKVCRHIYEHNIMIHELICAIKSKFGDILPNYCNSRI